MPHNFLTGEGPDDELFGGVYFAPDKTPDHSRPARPEAADYCRSAHETSKWRILSDGARGLFSVTVAKVAEILPLGRNGHETGLRMATGLEAHHMPAPGSDEHEAMRGTQVQEPQHSPVWDGTGLGLDPSKFWER